MRDYLCISQVLDLKKYDRTSRLADFQNKVFFITSIKAIKGNDKEGFQMTIEDEEGHTHNIKTFSTTIVKQLKDLLISAVNENGSFQPSIKSSLQISPIKIGNQYKERYKLV